MVLAGLATPLVISVHSIVSMDFATSLLPGWHTTLFRRSFVAGAVFSGFGMVTLLLIIARSAMGLHSHITVKHLDRMACIMLLTGSLVAFSYLTELFAAWCGDNPYEKAMFLNRVAGPYAWAFWTMVTCNVIVPQSLWLRRVRRTPMILAAVSLLVNVGMWFERFVIIVTSLHHASRAVGLGDVPADGGRSRHAHRQLRVVLHLLPALHPRPADDRDLGSQRDGRRPGRASGAGDGGEDVCLAVWSRRDSRASRRCSKR